MAEIQYLLNPTHITTSGAHSANVITCVPTGNIVSTTVQGAINELGTRNRAGSSIDGGPATSADLLNPISGDTNYQLAYTADGQRTHAGGWGRMVMRHKLNGETYGVRVDRSDRADAVIDPNFYRIANPGGGASVTRTGQQSGAIAIRLPVGMTDTMCCVTIKVYDYSVGESFEYHVCGYNYPVDNSWQNPTAYIVGNPSADRQFTVRLGYDSTAAKAMIYVGELSSVWDYPQVYVTEVLCGYGGYSEEWTSGWQIGFETSEFKNVTATINNCQIGYMPSNVFTGSKIIGGVTLNFVNGLLVE